VNQGKCFFVENEHFFDSFESLGFRGIDDLEKAKREKEKRNQI
jgi:hypothetical protein